MFTPLPFTDLQPEAPNFCCTAWCDTNEVWYAYKSHQPNADWIVSSSSLTRCVALAEERGYTWSGN